MKTILGVILIAGLFVYTLTLSDEIKENKLHCDNEIAKIHHIFDGQTGDDGLIHDVSFLQGKYYELECKLSPHSPGCDVYEKIK